MIPDAAAEHITAAASNGQGSPSAPPVPDGACRVLGAVFDERDRALIRLIETWKGEGERGERTIWDGWPKHVRISRLLDPAFFAAMLRRAAAERANIFYGVCPRLGPNGQYDLAWQIRTVRVLWADLDNCAVEEALERCRKAGLPAPSIVVCSGHGVHLYWILAEPYLIDDADRPPAVYKEFIDRGPGQKKAVRRYIEPKKGQRIYLYLPDRKTGGDSKTLNPECEWGELSPKAVHVQDVLGGIAKKIGGDHTKDISRLLRLPGTLNRKNERNGVEPVPCQLVECHPERRYAFADFEQFAKESPDRQKREKVAKIPLPPIRPLGRSVKRQEGLNRRIIACNIAPVGERSEQDWSLACFAVEAGVGKEELWSHVEGVGKFAEAGRAYFDRTFARAQNHTRLKLYERYTGQQAKRKSASSPPPRNGDGKGGGDEPPPPDDSAPSGDDDDALRIDESDTDPNRIARLWQNECAYHKRLGDKAAYYREQYWLWSGSRWRVIPDNEMRADIHKYTKSLFDREARLAQLDADQSDEKKTKTVPQVTNSLTLNVLAALQGDRCIPSDRSMPVWLGETPGPRTWIALRNGILDVDGFLRNEADVLRPHTPLWFSPVCLPYEFDPDADCPRWKAFLQRNLGDDSGKQRLLQQWAGYLLLPDTTQQKFLVMVGEGSNGKSVACEVLTALLGEENVSSEPLELFGDKFRLANTLGKLANITAEVGELDKVAEGYLKAFVVGDPMSFERKFKQAFTARPTARLMLATNNVPQFSDKSEGIWRRMILLPFVVRIAKEEEIAGMDKREWWQEQGELPGVLNWALAGLHDLRQQKRLTIPPSCKAAADEQRAASSSPRRFLTENYQAGADWVFKNEIYQNYVAWCKAHGCHPMGDTAFGRELKRVFPAVRDGKEHDHRTYRRENTYVGLAVRQD